MAKESRAYSADFETTTTAPVRVWLWGFCEIGNVENEVMGDDISSFFDEIFKPKYNKCKFFFHNLKFDGNFIVWYLLSVLKYEYSDDDEKPLRFTTLINKMAQWYEVKITNENHTITIRDSLKKLPMSVSAVSQAFALEDAKGVIDYEKPRPRGYVASVEEIDYLRKDIRIVANALQQQFNEKLTGMTVGSDALRHYKKQMKKFKDLFPILDEFTDKFIRKAYKGGYVYVNPKFRGDDIGNGVVYDVNSMYPWAMTQKMPYGLPIYTTVREELFDKTYPLYVIRIQVDFKVKEGFLPTVQIKGSRFFHENEYVTNSNGFVELTMTSIDYELFHKHYDIYEEQFICGYKFRAAYGMFDEYINYWSDVKAKSKGGKRTIAKLMLNSLYGKFAKNSDVTGKYPVLMEDGNFIKLVVGKEETSETVYVPVGAFITAYARNNLISSAQSVYDRFIYCDTDSLHLVGNDTVEGLSIHESKLGYWKEEVKFNRARFIKAKTYIEEVIDGDEHHLKVTASGMPATCYDEVTWENFHIGTVYNNKFKQRSVEGGALLEKTIHTLGV